MSTNYLIFVRRGHLFSRPAESLRGKALEFAGSESSRSRALGVAKRVFAEHNSDRNFVGVRVEQWGIAAALPSEMFEMDRHELASL